MEPIHHQHQRFCEHSLTFKGNTPRTILWYQSTFGHFLKWTEIDCVTAISRPLVEQYVMRGKIDHQWTARTIRNRLSALKLFVDWAVREGLVARNEVSEVPLPKLSIKIPEHLSREQAFALLEWARNFRYTYVFERHRAVAVIHLLIFSGIRAQELLNLNVEDVRFDEQTLFVRCGKGQKDRMIPLDQTLLGVLRTYLKDRDRLKRQHPRFFLQVSGDRPMTYKSLQKLVEKLRCASGIYFYPHMLRHTFATLMLEGGADLLSIKEMMGHSDIKTTMIYLTATTSHLRQAVSKHALNSAFLAPAPRS